MLLAFDQTVCLESLEAPISWFWQFARSSGTKYEGPAAQSRFACQRPAFSLLPRPFVASQIEGRGTCAGQDFLTAESTAWRKLVEVTMPGLFGTTAQSTRLAAIYCSSLTHVGTV